MTQPILPDDEFCLFLASRGRPLFMAARFLAEHPAPRDALTRPLVGCLLTRSAQFEELLDAYGATDNRRWHPLRSLTATIKRFSELTYELLHVLHVLPSYRLLPIKQDFRQATLDAAAFTQGVLHRSCRRLLEVSEARGLDIPEDLPDGAAFGEELIRGRLAQDRETRHVGSVGEIVTHLATAFLNLAVDTEMVHVASRARPEEFASCIPSPVSEKNLRWIQDGFHNLQSQYDTFVSGTETENIDPDLSVLRGHISVVFHLLRMATSMSHYYERHVASKCPAASSPEHVLVDGGELLDMLMRYAITFASQFISCAQALCQVMLQRYAEVGDIEVPIPKYRGFHVRPSTLVAKIVLHYGSEVCMKLADEKYDAGRPIEIFRANETINARKRSWLAGKVSQLLSLEEYDGGEDVQAIARHAVLALAERGELIIYQQPLQLPEHPVARTGTLRERVTDEIKSLQATGTIDIDCDLTVGFRGDKRVLADIELLAHSGYGEDSYGNNVPLPGKLSYLRR